MIHSRCSFSFCLLHSPTCILIPLSISAAPQMLILACKHPRPCPYISVNVLILIRVLIYMVLLLRNPPVVMALVFRSHSDSS